MGVSQGTESKTQKIGLVSTDTLHALDIPGTNDTKNTGLKFISMLTSVLGEISVDGIFIAVKAMNYRISDEIL